MLTIAPFLSLKGSLHFITVAAVPRGGFDVEKLERVIDIGPGISALKMGCAIPLQVADWSVHYATPCQSTRNTPSSHSAKAGILDTVDCLQEPHQSQESESTAQTLE